MGFTDNYTKRPQSTTTTAAVDSRKTSTKNSISPDESFVLNICDGDDEVDDLNKRRSLLIPDQEILDSTEEIYFQENVDTGVYELNVSWH